MIGTMCLFHSPCRNIRFPGQMRDAEELRPARSKVHGEAKPRSMPTPDRTCPRVDRPTFPWSIPGHLNKASRVRQSVCINGDLRQNVHQVLPQRNVLFETPPARRDVSNNPRTSLATSYTATPAMIQVRLISKTPTTGLQSCPTRFERVRWRCPENAGDPDECSGGRSTSTAETLPNNWQTTSLSNCETGLR